MRSTIHSLLAILHFWTFFLCPSLHAGQESYRIEVGVFEDESPEELRTSFKPLTSAEINDAQGYYLNVFVSRPLEERETEKTPWAFYTRGAVYKPCFSHSDCKEFHPHHQVIRNYDHYAPFSFSFLEEGKLLLTLPETFKDKIEVISPFSVLTHITNKKESSDEMFLVPTFSIYSTKPSEFPKPLHTFEFLSPSNGNAQPDIKGAMPFRNLTFQQKDFENNPSGWMIQGEEKSAAWEKINWETSCVVENTAHFLSQYVDVKAQGLINKGSLLAQTSTKVETSFLDNQNGKIKGARKTQVIVQNHLHNRDGVIGSGRGETHLELSPAFNQTNEGHELGKIKGHKLYVHGNGFQGLLHHGGLISKNEIHLTNSNLLVLKDVAVHTPLLTLNVPEFQSDKIPFAKKTRFLVGDYETFRFTTPYLTEGEVEFWQNGINSPHQAKEILQKRPHVLEPRDTLGKTIQIFAPIKAKKLSAYTPDYKFHAKHGCLDEAAINLKEGNLRAYVRSFDLETGSSVAQNAEIIAPNGIRIGDLVVDPNTNCLRELKEYREVLSQPLGNWRAAGSWKGNYFDNGLTERWYVVSHPTVTLAEN